MEPRTANASASGKHGRRKSRATGAEKPNLYDEVTARIIAELEAGRAPWVQPWGAPGAKAGLGLPKNALTGRTYSGVNILILWHHVVRAGFATQTWLTYRQAQEMGGHVMKGERGITACHADTFIPKAERERAEQDGDEPGRVPFLKRFTLFNVEQCEGLPDEAYAGAAPLPEAEIIPQAERLIEATGADFRIGGTKAFYVPSQDFIHVPPQPAFFEQVNYYRTCFHELGHWTGHETRLARDLSHSFGSKPYAREELVAEMASAFVCASLSIAPTVRHTDYIGSWLEVLREDNRAIFRAASQASKAADFILAFRDAEKAEAVEAAA
ncbi:ArdC family protein [Amphiplicatus metriothermophilus]|jgi:antirestriction protein ArdC|uniref:Antirestriction protein ArdC n=1 Tax=Amphiplicatus metriothermophilus TaxID=1519374 RepID=A0A239Q0E3_9PROT|nr:zincin-like metallopeptidase domain-containing protein [Amphiplicatus metriothermophilus]MBB5520134.1 antirestriction protein ArdC [Amphiplicatus metriothermophilus]SNT75723.1 Antirestriction protein ArdC [Amphiplicatus metriothermophilus]